MLTILVFLSGFLLSLTAAYYSIVGLIAIFPGATFAIVAMGVTLELAKLVSASWLYRNWKTAPATIKSYLVIAVLVLMFITSMGIFGFLSKSHLEHSIASTADNTYQLQSIDDQIASKQKTLSMLERQINSIDNSLEQYIANGSVTRGLQQKRNLDSERRQLETERRNIDSEIVQLKVQRNTIATEVKKQEVEVGPLKYIAELIYGEDAESHFDSAVRSVIILLIVVFDPLAVVLLIAGNISIRGADVAKEKVEPKRKKAYNKRKRKQEVVVEKPVPVVEQKIVPEPPKPTPKPKPKVKQQVRVINPKAEEVVIKPKPGSRKPKNPIVDFNEDNPFGDMR